MFKVYTIDDGRNAPLEYLPAGAITPKLGLALAMSGGKLVLAAGTTKPQYICMTERDAACAAGEEIPVIRVQSDMVFETTNSAAYATEADGAVTPTVVLGDKVTIDAAGGQVTATKASGVAEVVYIEDYPVGSRIHVRF